MTKLQASLKVVQMKRGEDRQPVKGDAKHKRVPSPAIANTERRPRKTGDSRRLIPSLRVKTYQELLQEHLNEKLKHLEAQATQVNRLSAELEAAIQELKAISAQVNTDLKSLRGKADICEYKATSLPYVGQKLDGSLVLTARSIDLYKAEREASSLAQKLRRRTGKKPR